jgi:DNA-directed RNA polymerase subunit B'/DNA-directed RNA polymerase subunit B
MVDKDKILKELIEKCKKELGKYSTDNFKEGRGKPPETFLKILTKKYSPDLHVSEPKNIKDLYNDIQSIINDYRVNGKSFKEMIDEFHSLSDGKKEQGKEINKEKEGKLEGLKEGELEGLKEGEIIKEKEEEINKKKEEKKGSKKETEILKEIIEECKKQLEKFSTPKFREGRHNPSKSFLEILTKKYNPDKHHDEPKNIIDIYDDIQSIITDYMVNGKSFKEMIDEFHSLYDGKEQSEEINKEKEEKINKEKEEEINKEKEEEINKEKEEEINKEKEEKKGSKKETEILKEIIEKCIKQLETYSKPEYKEGRKNPPKSFLKILTKEYHPDKHHDEPKNIIDVYGDIQSIINDYMVNGKSFKEMIDEFHSLCDGKEQSEEINKEKEEEINKEKEEEINKEKEEKEKEEKETKIYMNGELIGSCENPEQFVTEMREKRRAGEISEEMNITYYDKTSEIYIFNDPGRARRPLIIVKNGIPSLEPSHIQKIAEGKFKWDDLIVKGIVEFLDAEEEENSYIAMGIHDLNEDHTHLEIDPSTMLGICAGIIPFSNHNSSPRNTMEAGMTKQALGLYVSNYMHRTDTRAHLLHQPQTPMVKTRIIDATDYDKRPSGQNFIVAVMSFEGYNMEDGLILNKSSLERGLARSSFFRSYETFEKKYAGGQEDKFEVPGKGVRGYRSEKAYRHLDEDGIITPESYVEAGDVLIGKTSPPRFLEEIDEFGSANEKRRETSVTVRNGEKGVVDAVLLTETVGGSKLTKIRVRDIRQPEFGDKFASRHGQKGVVGSILSQEDVPFTENGVVPDLIINPHAIPSRMSIGQVLEMVAGKVGCIKGERVDGTPFNTDMEAEIKKFLTDNGFEPNGCESLYNGMTGERIEAEIFIGVAYYQKLHHMTTDKMYARSRGPVQLLTKQPTEGRAREGGLRFGEMERDCLIAHGATLALKERLLDESDKYKAIVCNECGMLSVHDKIRNKIYCPICGEVDSFPVEISYAFKLLLDELKSLCIFPKLILEDKA